MENVDLLVKNTKLYNSYLKMFTPADVYILGERIYFVDTAQEGNINAKKVIDGSGYYMLPGFIDIHMHIESSMMTPASFGERAASCGVTTLVSEPHEIANVMGVQGIHEMINGNRPFTPVIQTL